MINRISKTTSLLVAAAAMVSIIPASAADYKKIDSQEGTIYNAVAYKDGKFYIDGEVKDQDEAAYYLANGKYNDLSDIDSGSSVGSYGSKYVNIENGDYFVDLETGKVTDDSIKEDSEDDTATALRKNIKKDTDGRYNVSEAGTIKNLEGKELAGSKFTDLWYGVTYTSLNNTNGFTSPSQLNVYTDSKGKYIDGDYNLGSIKVTTNNGSTEKTVTIANTNDKYDGAGASKAVSASVSNQSVIGQDSGYIYRTAKITIKTTGSVSVTKINGLSISGKNAFAATTNEVSFNVIQKISKAQASDDIDGAKYAKTVTNYIISDDAGVDESGNLLSKYTVSNGKIITYKEDTSSKSIQTATIALSSKKGYYYTDIEDKADEDVEVGSNNNLAIDIDTNGNVWRLLDGYIYKWNNDEDWVKVYKVDGSFNEMSVYDDKNIVAWNEDDEVYSVIGGQTQNQNQTQNQTQNPKPAEQTPVIKKGWVKDNTGWTYYNASGSQIKGQWVNDGGVWYYIKADGVMATGWIQDGANWYYLNSSGAMLYNTTVNGYKLGPSGAWVK